MRIDAAIDRFNPRARVGRDSNDAPSVAPSFRFNPRARVGRDEQADNADRLGAAVSIHAPAWGATNYGQGGPHSYMVSIHAPAWGATGGTGGCIIMRKFQSTRPRGARRFSMPSFGGGR